jgi:hypothetical protein
MADAADIKEEIEQIKRENAQLSGLALATGVILTQLLQTIASRELNPQGAATKIVNNARSAIEAFQPETPGERDPIMKERALEAVKQYETQLRSVLRD